MNAINVYNMNNQVNYHQNGNGYANGYQNGNPVYYQQQEPSTVNYYWNKIVIKKRKEFWLMLYDI